MSVYFITAREVGLVKIGCAFNPEHRLNAMQCGSPVELKLEAVVPGAYAEEGALHAHFAHLRNHREWFAINDEVEALIAENAVTGIKPSPALLKKARELQGPRANQRGARDDAHRYATAIAEMCVDREHELE